MTDINGTTLDALTPEAVADAVPTHLPDFDGEVLVLPDAHYPFHHSTGLVTAPPVLEGVLDYLDETAATVSVGVVDSAYVDSDRATDYLGYPELLEGTDAELVDLGAAATTELSPSADGPPVRVTVPRPVADATVLNLPTLRMTAAFGMGGGLVNLARVLAPGEPLTEDRIRAAHAALDPVPTLVDCYAIFTGQPFRTRLLFSGHGAAAVDRALVEDVFDVAGDDEVFPVDPSGPTNVRGIRESDLPEEVPVQSLSSSSGVLQKGYRFYTRLSGDALAPQSMEKQ